MEPTSRQQLLLSIRLGRRSGVHPPVPEKGLPPQEPFLKALKGKVNADIHHLLWFTAAPIPSLAVPCAAGVCSSVIPLAAPCLLWETWSLSVSSRPTLRLHHLPLSCNNFLVFPSSMSNLTFNSFPSGHSVPSLSPRAQQQPPFSGAALEEPCWGAAGPAHPAVPWLIKLQ